jgi:ATP-binding cassette subfamily B protein
MRQEAETTVENGVSRRWRGWYASRLRRWHGVARLLPAAGAGAVAGSIAVNLLLGLLPLVFVTLTSVMLGDMSTARPGSGPAAAAVAALGTAVGAFALQQLLAPWQSALGELIARRVDGHCIERLGRAALVGAPIRELERPENIDVLSDARSGFERAMPTPGEAVAGALALIARYVQLAGALVLVAAVFTVPAGLVLAAVALTVRFGQRGSLGKIGAMWAGLADLRRRTAYLRAFGAGTKAAKELRLFGVLGWYRERHLTDARRYLGPLWRGRRRLLLRPFVGYALVGLSGAAGILAWLGARAAHGGVSVLELSVAIQAALIPVRFGVYFAESDMQTQYGLQGYDALTEFERLAGLGPHPASRGGAATPAVPAAAVPGSAVPAPAVPAPRREIRFEHVSFAYRADAEPVLKGVELTLQVGRSTAIVGLNGAGKTTLVKLLAGFYPPTEGRILVDGADLGGLDPRGWQRRLAVIFQDYVRYELDAAANIGFGSPAHLRDAEAIRAAADRAGAGDVLAGLPQGLDTVLSRHYRGGVDLSGGQWQRIALSRALFAARHGASVLVLDEPTAQLDVRAEVDFYDRFLDLTRGLTTVLISHRFSTLRRADTIAVLDGGRVVEQGGHDELVALGGAYARLFELQSRQFAEPLGERA